MIAEDLAHIENPTVQERSIIVFVLKNPEFIESHTAEDLAKASFTSASTVSRLCQRIGLKGYGEFKMRFVAEWKASAGNQFARLSEPLINGEVAAVDLAELMPRFYNRVVYETDRLLSPGRLDEFIDRLDASSSVQFCACGLNAYIAQESCFKLQAVGLNAQSCDAVNVQAIKHRGDPAATVGVVISHTGANAATIRAESLFRENGIWCAAFTPGDASPVARAADLSLRLFCTSSADRLSLLSYPISVRYMLDLVYAALFSRRVSDVFSLTALEFYGPEEN